MRAAHSIAVIVPALNEERSIGKVLSDIPHWVDRVIVADNGSTDATAEIARRWGAQVVSEPRRGYGAACLTALAYLDPPDIVVFLDGDYSDYPEEMDRLVDPIIEDLADFIIGSRVLGAREPGALTLQARFGNWLACALIRWFWGVPFTDLGPFRAIRYTSLSQLEMKDKDYGWTVEMQIKAVVSKLRTREVPVSYRRRIGTSKVSGTLRGIVGAGSKILGTILLFAVRTRTEPDPVRGRERIILFSRYPEPGKAKTRLIPVLGSDGAARMSRVMTERTVRTLRRVAIERSATLDIFFDGANESLFRAWLGPGRYTRQSDGTLGDRMHRAFQAVFRDGADRAVMVGTDCPGLSQEIVRKALVKLNEGDVVLGPAADGGYYLIGMRRPQPHLFRGMHWGTETVLAETVAAARRTGLRVELVDRLNDIDRPEDLGHWEEMTSSPLPVRARMPSITVIVPTLNEAESLPNALTSVLAGGCVEIIVVDGGSSDGTVDVAQSFGAVVFSARGGRSIQMNEGAKLSRAEVLLFLHADTLLPPDWEDHVAEAISTPDVVGGAFRIRIDSDLRGLRTVERLANMRSLRLGIPYGDQALFVRRSIFDEIRGFPPIPILEDLELVLRLRARGKLVITRAYALTSARRWKELGVLRTSLTNQLMLVGRMLGCCPHDLTMMYRHASSYPVLLREFLRSVLAAKTAAGRSTR